MNWSFSGDCLLKLMLERPQYPKKKVKALIKLLHGKRGYLCAKDRDAAFAIVCTLVDDREH